MKNKIELELLENFILNNPELDKLEALLSQFNIFETLNIVDAEIRHSSVLSWLLNPSANHGLGSHFVKQFLKYLISKNQHYLDPRISLFDFEIFNYSDLEILREWKKIDILMILKEENEKYVIAIENKIKTKEHGNQLQRYREIVENEFRDFIKIYVYLTPDELIPSDENWVKFSYKIIADLLGDLIRDKKNTLNENILNFISQYETILRRYRVGESKIEQICRQIYKKHQQAIDLIFQYRPDVALEISEYLKTQLKQKKDINLEVAGKTVIRFSTQELDDLINKASKGWADSKRILYFEFENRENKLVLRLYIGPGEQNFREKIMKICKKNENLFKLAMRPYFGKKYHAVYQKEFLKKKNFEDSTTDELKEIIFKKLSEFLQNGAVKINKYFQENWKSN